MKQVSFSSILIYLVLFLALLLACLTSCATVNSSSISSDDVFSSPEPLDDEYRNYYEIFVWSFFDTDNNGIGDFNGITAKLDYIKEMGFNGIWLMPMTKGTSYHKYDVEDYYAVDPDFGTMEDFQNLLAEAHKRNINIIIDLVVNHTSSSNPWFIEACDYIRANGQPGGTYGDYYNFQQKSESGYTQVAGTNWYYESQFTSTMPDLNLDSEQVKEQIVNIMKFWLDMGVDGFRLDATTSYYTNNKTKSIQFLGWLNEQAKAIKPDCYLVAEAWYTNDVAVREYYDSGIDSCFCFPLAMASGHIYDALKDIRANNGVVFGVMLKNAQDIYNIGIYAPFLSNHDTARIASFMGRRQTDKIKMAQGLLSLQSGCLFVYYGEEIGMISTADGSDPYKRIAMKWCDKNVYEGWCYTAPQGITVTKDNYYYSGVAEQEEDVNSILNYYKASLRIRNANPEIARGEVEVLESYYEQSKYCCVCKWTWNDSSVVAVVNLDREWEHNIVLDVASLGVTSMTDFLCANADSVVSYDSASGTVTLAPYSYAIFR